MTRDKAFVKNNNRTGQIQACVSSSPETRPGLPCVVPRRSTRWSSRTTVQFSFFHSDSFPLSLLLVVCPFIVAAHPASLHSRLPSLHYPSAPCVCGHLSVRTGVLPSGVSVCLVPSLCRRLELRVDLWMLTE